MFNFHINENIFQRHTPIYYPIFVERSLFFLQGKKCETKFVDLRGFVPDWLQNLLRGAIFFSYLPVGNYCGFDYYSSQLLSLLTHLIYMSAIK